MHTIQINTFKKDCITSIFVTSHMKSDGEIINNNSLCKAEQFSIESSDYIEFTISNYYKFCIDAFLNKSHNSNAFKNKIHHISNHNYLCESHSSWSKELENIIISVCNKQFDRNFETLLFCFEYDLKFYFKSQKISIKQTKKNINDDINLGNIFNNSPKNQYRDKLLETIDEDYYFTLKWLLTDKSGGNYRNKIIHGKMPPDNINSYEVVLTIYLIIRLYLGFIY